MTCLGLHGPEVPCVECGTPEPSSVADIHAWQRLEQSIVSLYLGDLANLNLCADLSIQRTAATCGVSRHFVEKTLRKHKVIT